MNADVTVALVFACLLNLVTGVGWIWEHERRQDAEDEAERLRNKLAQRFTIGINGDASQFQAAMGQIRESARRMGGQF